MTSNVIRCRDVQTTLVTNVALPQDDRIHITLILKMVDTSVNFEVFDLDAEINE